MKPWTSALCLCTRALRRLKAEGRRQRETHPLSILLSALCLLASAFLLASCAPHEPRADLVILNGGEPESLDPAIISGQLDGRVVQSLFEGLMRFDPVTAKPVPGLA